MGRREDATVNCMLFLQNRWSNGESSLPQKGLSFFKKKEQPFSSNGERFLTLFKQR